jgi:HEAT repeat protein
MGFKSHRVDHRAHRPQAGTDMTLFILLLATALADAPGDLEIASSKDVSDAIRMEAFERLVDLGSTDMAYVSEIAQSEAADTRLRWVAIRALGQIKGDRARNLLISLSEDPQPAIRTAACGAMGDFGHEDFVPYLVRLVQDPAVIVRATATQSLAAMGDERAIDALSDALQDKKNTFRGQSIWVRKYFVEALGGIGSKKGYPALLRVIDDADATVSGAVIPALESIAGFSYKEGRSESQEREAWRRFLSNELRNTR